MPLNEFGDFFAGVFGPLMLFWLILGHMQQQKELQQNTSALELQAQELKRSVEQHKELVKATKEQVEADLKSLEIEQNRVHKEAHPEFSIISAGTTQTSAQKKVYAIQIKNTGKPAASVMYATEPDIPQISKQATQNFFDTGAVRKLGWDNLTSGEAPLLLKLVIMCRDSNTNQYTKIFLLQMGDRNQYEVISQEDVS